MEVDSNGRVTSPAQHGRGRLHCGDERTKYYTWTCTGTNRISHLINRLQVKRVGDIMPGGEDEVVICCYYAYVSNMYSDNLNVSV